MNIEQVRILMEKYKEVHEEVFQSVGTMEGWPVCSDPHQRSREFNEYLKSLPYDDWIDYYMVISNAIDTLVFSHPKKDVTKVNNEQL